jgi:transposase
MRPAKILELKAEERAALEGWMRSADIAPVVRLRTQVILLKAQERTAEDIASIVGMCSISVHSWIKRYRTEGISGLLTKPGRGRKKILSMEVDAPAITQNIKEHRQSLKAAKAAYEVKGGQVVSEETFRAFLKSLATPIKESESGWVRKQTKTYTSIK